MSGSHRVEIKYGPVPDRLTRQLTIAKFLDFGVPDRIDVTHGVRNHPISSQRTAGLENISPTFIHGTHYPEN